MYEVRILRDTIQWTQKYFNFHLSLNQYFDGFTQKGTQVILFYKAPLTEEQQSAIQLADVGFVDSDPLTYICDSIIIPARQFGQTLINRFAAENVLLGITQAGKTNYVRKALREITDCLNSGSLYDAIYECRQIPSEAKDNIFITDARLLCMINEIERYLKMILLQKMESIIAMTAIMNYMKNA